MFRLKGPKGERGVSVVLGATLVIGIIIAFFSAFFAEWVPKEVGRREHTHMRGVEESFRELRATIAGMQTGEFGSVDVSMGAEYAIPPLPTTREVGTLSVIPAETYTVRIPPSDDAYVVENSPTNNFGRENSLRVASRRDNNRRSFLKFSLEGIPKGAMIFEANLWLYCSDNKSTLENVTDVRCYPVDNDNWTENNLTWRNQPDNMLIYEPLDSRYVGGVGWEKWTVKDFVDQEVKGDKSLSLVLRTKQENYDNIDRYVSFVSKDNVTNANKPYLEVMYTTGPPIWKQTDWEGENTDPVLQSDKWDDDYDNYYWGENENAKTQGEVRLDNEIPSENGWFQTTKEDFENGTSRENLDTSTTPGDITLQYATVIFGNNSNPGGYSPYANYTYIQRVDPAGQYAAPYNGVIIQWNWRLRSLESTNGARFKIFRNVTGTVWTMVGQSEPKNLSSGLNTFSDSILVMAGDRIGGYTGSERPSWSSTSGYYASRTEGNVQGTSAFTEHLDPRRLPIDATLKYYITKGTFVSRVYDTKGLTSWREISWGESLHPSTDITLQARVGTDNNPYLDNGSPDEENWTVWSANYTNPSGELINLPKSRYIQYKVNFSSEDTAHTPVLYWVKIDYITSAMYKPSGQLESSVYDAGSTVDWRTISWVAETPTLEEENKSVETEPDPLVDWSPLIGENLSPFESALAYDNIYENIAEELRRPWWDRSWACRRLVTVNNGDNALENYQVEIEVDYDNDMHPNFDDLRFVDNDNVTELSYWIEDYNPGENAIVWVKIPSIPADDNKTFYMYYGNPGARPASDFSATFPNALIIDGTVRTLGGVQRYDWVEIRNGGFLVVQSENILELFARKIIVRENSYIYAVGSGYSGGPTNRWHGLQENGASYGGGDSFYAHQETITIAGTSYYLLKKSSADNAGMNLSVSMGSTGRQLLGRFVYSLSGINSLPATTLKFDYRAWHNYVPIAFDSASSITQTTTATSVSWNHTTGTGSNRLLLVAVNVHVATGTPTTVTSVTYGGTALTQVTTDLYSATNPQVRTYVFRLTNPASGTNSITVNFAASTLSVCGAVTYFNVDQSSPIQTSSTANGSGTSQSASVTITGEGRWVFGHLTGHRTAAPAAWTITEGSGQTNRWAQQGQLYKGKGSDRASVSPGTITMSWTTNRVVSWVASAVVINPAISPPVAHMDVNILIRRSDGTVRQTIATNVANSENITSTPTTHSATYSWDNYTVVDQSDYLEIDYYCEVTTASVGITAFLRIDDNTLGLAYQTRFGTGTSGGTGGYEFGTSDGPGGGGGAYGGSGGNGGGARGANDYPGIGGSAFGSASDNSIYIGSGGGSGGLSMLSPENNPWNAGGAGGAGGGGIRLNAGIIEISGTVSADGGNGAGGMCGSISTYDPGPPRGNGGGGGGSGGTILIEGYEIVITGTLSSNGGKGGARSQWDPGGENYYYGGAGGGGGGGRIKVFYDKKLDNANAKENVAEGASGGPSYENEDGIVRENGRGAEPGKPGTIYTGTISYPEPTTSVGSEELESEAVELGYCLNWEHRVTGIELGSEKYTFNIRGYSDNDGENIGVYIWMSKMNSWSLIDYLPKVPGDPITYNIQPRDLSDYLVGDNLSIGYFDSGGDPTRTVIHIDYCILEVMGYFSTEVRVYTRTGDTENAYDGSWDNWQPAANGDEVPSDSSRYIQYRVELLTQNGKITPVFKEITITHRKFSEYGVVGFSSGHVFYPDQAYIYEGGSVILAQGGVNLTVLDPMMITWKNDPENENLIWVYVNFRIIENKEASVTSTGTRTIRVFCVNSRSTIYPVEGPNRDDIVLRVSSPYGDVWSRYLSDKLEELGAMASFDPNTLTITIMGKDDTPGVKDIYYYENLAELEVELV